MFRFFVRSKRYRSEQGFTLIEIFIVLTILSILLGIAIPRYVGARKRAFKAEADGLLAEVKTLSWSYYQEYSSFPPNIAALGYQHPSGSVWNTPNRVAGDINSIHWNTSGNGTKAVVTTDLCSVLLSSTGETSQGCTF